MAKEISVRLEKRITHLGKVCAWKSCSSQIAEFSLVCKWFPRWQQDLEAKIFELCNLISDRLEQAGSRWFAQWFEDD